MKAFLRKYFRLRSRIWPWLAILAILLLTGFIRVRLLEMPLERDEGEYAYAGQLILQGIPPYQLAYNMKLPGTYYAYAAGMSVFGQSIAGVHWTLLAANALTILFVFLLGAQLLGKTGGAAAGVTYAIMSVSPAVLGLAAHATHFVVLFAVPGIWLLWRAAYSNDRRTIFLGGLLLGLAVVMKQQGICFGIFGVAFLVWQAIRNRSFLSFNFLKQICCFGFGLILPFLLVCLEMARAGVFQRFWFWTFTYARSYAANNSFSQGVHNLHGYLHDEIAPYLGFLALITAGLVLVIRAPKAFQRRAVFGIGFMIFSFVGTGVGLYFREHYFILMLPAFSLLVGLAVALLKYRLPPAMKMAPVVIITGIVVADIGLQIRQFFRMTPLQLCQSIYGGNPFAAARPVAQYVRENSGLNASVAVIGSEPEIYFYSNRRAATGYIYTYPLMESQPYALTMQKEMIGEIEAHKPEFLVMVMNRFSWNAQSSSDSTIVNWANAYTGKFYDPVGIVGEDGPVLACGAETVGRLCNELGQCMIIFKRKADAN